MGQWGVEGVDFLPPIGCLTCMLSHALSPLLEKKKKKKKESGRKKWYRKIVPTKCIVTFGITQCHMALTQCRLALQAQNLFFPFLSMKF
jgi:hypothetical protein